MGGNGDEFFGRGMLKLGVRSRRRKRGEGGKELLRSVVVVSRMEGRRRITLDTQSRKKKREWNGFVYHFFLLPPPQTSGLFGKEGGGLCFEKSPTISCCPSARPEVLGEAFLGWEEGWEGE